MAYANILLATAEGVATVTVNRPDKLNALNAATVEELTACFTALARDPEVRSVLLTGAGEKAFVAGADIAELAQLSPVQAERLAARGQALMDLIERLGKPVVAAVNGFALGGGCELAMACSFRYAAETAKLGLPETGLGLIPGYGGTQRLPRLVGRGRALEMILTGDMVTATEALALGLVDKVFPAADLPVAARRACAKMAARSQLALRLTLQAVHDGLPLSLAGGCAVEAALFGVCGSSADAREGCAAFLEKRKPDFRDR